ncbi:hypothetical protein GCM10022393_21210 [Aquimarina addita]|uniref:Uncharacterized protein n=1 Tax=Aquimarina addita TaxID=870485 RepID=A0ABP6ULB7_9FLAO
MKNKGNDIELVQKYYNELNNSNYSKISQLVGDSITLSEGGYYMNFSENDYYRFFQWDSVFSPTYKVLEINQKNNTIEVTISKLCDRIQFLNEKPTTAKEIFEIREHQITTITTTELNFDYKLWDLKKNKIISWIKLNHPELDGFIYDQTKNGAQKYLKAIALYNKFNKL